MASRPTSVRVCHAVLPVEYLTEKQWKQKDLDITKAGLSWWSGGRIRIRLDQEGEKFGEAALKETLLHEVLHMCWAVANMDGQGKIEDMEEWVVGNLSFPLMQVLVDNPRLLAYLME